MQVGTRRNVIMRVFKEKERESRDTDVRREKMENIKKEKEREMRMSNSGL